MHLGTPNALQKSKNQKWKKAKRGIRAKPTNNEVQNKNINRINNLCCILEEAQRKNEITFSSQNSTISQKRD